MKLRVPIPASGRAAPHRTKRRRALTWLTGVVVFGSVIEFNQLPADAQASLLDDGAPMARTTALSPLSNHSATYDEATSNAAGPRMSARVVGQDTEADGQQKDPAPLRAAGQAAPALANPLWGLPLKQLSVTRERPIFSPSRRPPAPAPTYVAPVAVKPPPKPREPERPTIALAGTIIGTDGYRVAVFRDTSTQDVVRLRMGENYHGWVVHLINPREARLVKDGEQARLELPLPAGTPAAARSSKDIMLDQVWAVGAE
jgi:hypothetical protein